MNRPELSRSRQRQGDIPVAAPSEQAFGGENWSFVEWSNGGARQQSAAATSTAALTLSASYRRSDLVFEDGFEP